MQCFVRPCAQRFIVFHSSKADPTNIEIIGFDLGHGETAVAATSLASEVPPQVKEIIGNQNSILTAVDYVDTENGKIVVIGDDAFAASASNNFNILFKSPNLSRREVSDPIKLFVRKCLDTLKDNSKINWNDNTYFIVGCPSGWSTDDRLLYQDILKESGMLNVRVKPESRAAFLDAREAGILGEPSRLKNTALIIDIGSSTTDFTLVSDFKEQPLDFGHNRLGGSLFDLAIFNLALDRQPGKANLHELFSRDTSLKAKCILVARRVKEQYFSKPEKDRQAPSHL